MTELNKSEERKIELIPHPVGSFHPQWSIGDLLSIELRVGPPLERSELDGQGRPPP